VAQGLAARDCHRYQRRHGRKEFMSLGGLLVLDNRKPNWFRSLNMPKAAPTNSPIQSPDKAPAAAIRPRVSRPGTRSMERS